MSALPKHINVCICTFRRQHLLKRLLWELAYQNTAELFSYSIVIADNDHERSARHVVAAFAATAAIPVIYCVEPVQNIALARNKALEDSTGDFVAFIDDDEVPVKDWLLKLFKATQRHAVDGVLGPVVPSFEHSPPSWVVKGKFFERPRHPTGYRLAWPETRTGNVLFRRKIIEGCDYPFNPEFGTGSEDVDFFRRMTEKGHLFIWCDEAIVYESVPPSRCTSRYLLKLALLRGGNSAKIPAHRTRSLMKAIIAVPLYAMALPVLTVSGVHIFMRYLVKLLDHSGRLLAFFGWNPVRKRGV